jgi:hypothetical protein
VPGKPVSGGVALLKRRHDVERTAGSAAFRAADSFVVEGNFSAERFFDYADYFLFVLYVGKAEFLAQAACGAAGRPGYFMSFMGVVSSRPHAQHYNLKTSGRLSES